MNITVNNVGNWVGWWAKASPEKAFLICNEQNLNYSQVNDRINKYCDLIFHSYKIQKGDRVACCLENRIDYLSIVFACAKSGAIVVPINNFAKSENLDYYLQDSDPKLLFYSDKTSKLIKENKYATCCCINIDDKDFTDQLAAASSREPVDQAVWEDPLAIMYTSGTTGSPKGAVITHAGVRATSSQSARGLGYSDDERQLIALKLCFAGALIGLVMPIAYCGGSVVIDESFNPERFLRLIREQNVTRVNGVPTMFQRLTQCPEFKDADFSHVRQFGTGGAPIPDKLIEAYRNKGVVFLEEYGITEGSSVNLFHPRYLTNKPGAYVPFINNPVRVVREDGSDAAPGETGELLIGGDAVLKCYWNKPEATKKAIIDGWLHTGDLCSVDESGYIYIAGRIKDIIITGGLNVSPSNIENVLCNYPNIAESSVVGLPHKDWGEAITAFVVSNDGQPVSEKGIVDFCKERLVSYMVPKAIIQLDALPRNINGKVLKDKLRQSYSHYFQ